MPEARKFCRNNRIRLWQKIQMPENFNGYHFLLDLNLDYYTYLFKYTMQISMH